MERAKGFFGLGADWDLVRFIPSFLSLASSPTQCLNLTGTENNGRATSELSRIE